MGIIRYKDVPYGGGGTSVTPNPSGTATANLEKVQIESTVYAIKDSNAVHGSDKGTANGVASLDANGKVPSAQLPSYVDDVVEGYYDTTTDRFYEESTFTTVIPPEDGKSWVDVASNKSYRWTGSVYVRVDEGVQLGETSNTAYRGDRGKTAYDHATESGKISTAVASGLYKIAATAEGHIASLTAAVKADFTALGVADAADIPTKTSDLTNDSGFITSNLITGVKGNAESAYRTGNVNLTPANIGAIAKSGDEMSGILSFKENAVGINFRPSNNDYSTTTSYQTTGNEALVFATKNAVTSFMFVNGEDSVTNHNSNRWQSLTPGLQIKNNKVAIGKLIANGTNLTYSLEVNGDVQATNFRGALIGNADTATKASQNANGVAFGDLATINKGSGSSKFLREDGTWQTVTASWSGGQVTSNIYPNAQNTIDLGDSSHRFKRLFTGNIALGYNVNASIAFYQQYNNYFAELLAPSETLTSGVSLRLPSASGTLVTDSYLNSNYCKITTTLDLLAGNKSYATGATADITVNNWKKYRDLIIRVTYNNATSVIVTAPVDFIILQQTSMRFPVVFNANQLGTLTINSITDTTLNLTNNVTNSTLSIAIWGRK